MYNFKKSLITLLGLLLLVTVVAAITPFQAVSQQSPETVAAVQDVRVVNPATAPVQTKIINGTTAPVPTKILNPATAPVMTRGVDEARASNNVVLASNDGIFQRVINGVRGSSEFVVPAGQTLIVTDVQWLEGCNSCPAGTGAIMFLSISPGSAVYESFAQFNNGFAFGTDSMTTGFTVPSGKSVRANTGVNDLIDGFLQGYLVPTN